MLYYTAAFETQSRTLDAAQKLVAITTIGSSLYALLSNVKRNPTLQKACEALGKIQEETGPI